MKLLLESNKILAFGASVEIDGVGFLVVSLVKQGYYNQMYWIYEVKVAQSK